MNQNARVLTPPEAVEVFGDRLEKAERYVELLATEGIERGLIGPREGERLWSRHVLNSTAVAQAIPDSDQAASDTDKLVVCDVGSGAGLPGIPLALVRPDLSVRLIEPLLRRTTFLEQVIEDLGIDVAVYRGRAEDPGIIERAGVADFVTARAVAPLHKLAKWCAPLLKDGGTMIALKGETAEEEVKRDAIELRKAGFAEASIRTAATPGGETTFLVVAKNRATLKRAKKSRRR